MFCYRHMRKSFAIRLIGVDHLNGTEHFIKHVGRVVTAPIVTEDNN